MLGHQKIVMKGVSNDQELFRKELIKSIKWLKQNDLLQFRDWVIDSFYHLHPEIIDELLYPQLEFSKFEKHQIS